MNIANQRLAAFSFKFYYTEIEVFIGFQIQLNHSNDNVHTVFDRFHALPLHHVWRGKYAEIPISIYCSSLYFLLSS